MAHKETQDEKGKRLDKLNAKIGKLLEKNHAGIFAIPNALTKTIHLQVMDKDDLEDFNKQVQENIKKAEEEGKQAEEGVKKTISEEGDKITIKKKPNGKA